MGWFKKVTKAVSLFDRATNPIHKAFQDEATQRYFGGSNERALATVHGVGVTVLDIVGGIFGYPGAGSFLNGTDQLQDGNNKGAVMSFASAAVQVGASSNTSGWSNLTNSSTASTTTTAATTAATESSIKVAFDTPSDYASFFGPEKTVVGSGIYGYTGAAGSTVTGIPSGTFTVGTGGAIGIDYATAVANGIPNLSLKDFKNGAGFVKTAAGMYDLMTRDGTVTASYGKGALQVPNESINYQFSAPSNMWAIPSNRAQDIAASNQVAQQMQAQADQQKMVMLAVGCGIVIYFLGAFK